MITSIGIIGSGKMGMDIFNFFNDYSFKLSLICETDIEANERLRSFTKQLNRKVKNGLLNEKEAENKIQNTIITSNFSAIKESDLIIECIPEIVSGKKDIFKKIENSVSSNTILTSNTSSIHIADIATSLNNSKRFMGMHFFYPVKLKNIIELNIHNNTSLHTVEIITELLSSINRYYLVLPEHAGFLLNKIFLDFQALGFWYYKNDSISISTLDNLIKKYLFPIGIFDFFDSVGIDTMLFSIINYTKNVDNGIYYIMIDELESLVNRNKLGIKTGCGFYEYGSEPQDKFQNTESVSDEKQVEIVNWLRASYINSAFKFIEQGFISKQDMDYAVKEYMGVDKGPVALAEEIGYDRIITSLKELQKITGSTLFVPSSLLKNK